MIKFGPSGTGERFTLEGYKKTEQAALWLKNQNLDIFEYSFGRGVNLKEDTALSFNKAFSEAFIELSVHAPYYINFASPEEEKIENSFRYVIDSAVVAKKMGARRVIFHPASQGKEVREAAVFKTKESLKRLAEIIRAEGLDDLLYCPETMGKIVQIGTVEEVTDFCRIDEIFIPTVDFGHVNAREQGSLKTSEDFEKRIQYMINVLGYERVKNFHVHFSKIQYSPKGEVRHLNFDDNVYGPEYEPFIDACLKLKVEPHVVCESAGNQTDDSILMKNYYLSKYTSEK